MQKWEYCWINRQRGWDVPKDAYTYMMATDWSWPMIYSKSDQGRTVQIGIVELVNKLGEEGWELVSVIERSSYLGGQFWTKAGRPDFIDRDIAGFTDTEVLVFKRPIGVR